MGSMFLVLSIVYTGLGLFQPNDTVLFGMQQNNKLYCDRFIPQLLIKRREVRFQSGRLYLQMFDLNTSDKVIISTPFIIGGGRHLNEHVTRWRLLDYDFHLLEWTPTYIQPNGPVFKLRYCHKQFLVHTPYQNWSVTARRPEIPAFEPAVSIDNWLLLNGDIQSPLPNWDIGPRSNGDYDFFIINGTRLLHYHTNMKTAEGQRLKWLQKNSYQTSCEEEFWIHRSGDDLFMVTKSGLFYRTQEYQGRWHMAEVLSKRPRIRVLIFDEDTQTAYAFGKGYGIALTGKAEPFACPDIVTPGLHHNPLPVLQRAWQQVQERRRTLLLATLRWW
jgi:hypothetical protein